MSKQQPTLHDVLDHQEKIDDYFTTANSLLDQSEAGQISFEEALERMGTPPTIDID